jgi:hypothetical protein
MAISKELKEAIVLMPVKEKDKLLLRLIGKNENLLKQLEFELLEEGETMESRREEVKAEIDKLYRLSAYSSGYLMMDMRYVNARITEHVKVTKDKYGEVELTLKLLNDCFEKHLKWIEKYSSKSDTLASYVAKRTEFVLNKVKKLHPDIQFEFEEGMNLLLERVNQYAPALYAIELKLPKYFEIEYKE